MGYGLMVCNNIPIKDFPAGEIFSNGKIIFFIHKFCGKNNIFVSGSSYSQQGKNQAKNQVPSCIMHLSILSSNILRSDSIENPTQKRLTAFYHLAIFSRDKSFHLGFNWDKA